jgi:hypothetical protein
VAIYRNTRFIDRAIAVFDHRVESDPARLLAAVRDPAFDPARTIWLEEPAAEPPANAGPADTPSSANVRITRYEPDHVALEAQMPRSGFVVLMDTYFPGWTATIDGHPVPIYRADYDYRAVQVSAGAHTVTFEYRPWSFRWGLMASLVGLTLIAVVWRR